MGGERTAGASASSADRISLGIALIISAVFLLSLADASVKYLSHRMPIWQLFLGVSFISVPTLGAWLVTGIKAKNVAVLSLRWVAVRSLLLLMMWVAYYSALPLIPLSVAAVAICTTPLFIALFAAGFGSERLTSLMKDRCFRKSCCWAIRFSSWKRGNARRGEFHCQRRWWKTLFQLSRS